MKRIYFLLLAVLIFGISGCNPYRKITFSNAEFYKKKRVSEHIDRYDIIVHQGDQEFELTEANLENESLTGKLEPVAHKDQAFDLKELKNSKEAYNDIHLYLNDADENIEKDSLNSVQIDESDLSKAEMYAKDDDGLAGAALTLLVLLIVITILGLILLIAAINNAGKGNTSNSSTSDSGGSNSSGSDSGGSNSGGSSSGCYIATMTYGSYDAPEVLLFRRFRDQFLQKFGGGRAFIRWYYAHSPAFVEKHKSKLWLHKILRFGLNGFAKFLKLFFPV